MIILNYADTSNYHKERIKELNIVIKDIDYENKYIKK